MGAMYTRPAWHANFDENLGEVATGWSSMSIDAFFAAVSSIVSGHAPKGWSTSRAIPSNSDSLIRPGNLEEHIARGWLQGAENLLNMLMRA